VTVAQAVLNLAWRVVLQRLIQKLKESSLHSTKILLNQVAVEGLGHDSKAAYQ
jgi:hypothetical protein